MKLFEAHRSESSASALPILEGGPTDKKMLRSVPSFQPRPDLPVRARPVLSESGTAVDETERTVSTNTAPKFCAKRPVFWQDST